MDYQPISIVRTWLYAEATPSADIFRGGLAGVVERRYRRCAVVGNSGVVLRHRNGARVDEHDMARTAPVLHGYHSLLFLCTDIETLRRAHDATGAFEEGDWELNHKHGRRGT